MIRKIIAGVAAGAALAAPLALAAPAQATENGPTILGVVDSVDRFKSTEVEGLDKFRWDQRNWYDFDILTAAVVANGALAGAVQDPKTAVTLFAPNDRAFQLLAFDLTGKWYATEAGVLKAILGVVGDPEGELLTTVLTYHVVGGKVTKAEVPIKENIPTASGLDFQVKAGPFGTLRIDDDNTSLRDPFIIRTDIDAGHSVIHSVSRVIMPAL
jgi:uncharacterized surface protein with fasciclin (FAS1) repeats